MKILVVYYSRTGTTAKIAKEIADGLKCDIEEIHDRKNRNGIIKWFIAGRDGMSKSTTDIKKTAYNPSQYELIIIGTPIWVNATPAIRTYLKENTGNFKNIAFFCTMGGSVGKNAFLEMEQIAGKKPLTVMELRSDDIKNGNYKQTLQKFISEVKR